MASEASRRGRGRPEIGPAINVRLPAGLLKQLDRWAADHDEARAGAVRRLLEGALAGESTSPESGRGNGS